MTTHLLFVCTANSCRSPTAEALYSSSRKYEARSAGVSPFANRPVTRDLLEWADIIFVMDERTDKHRTILLERFSNISGLERKIRVLDVPDVYEYGDPELVSVLQQKLRQLLPDLNTASGS
jgi:predicted protein tyrosine phosphatase